jgi:hypothetical protein
MRCPTCEAAGQKSRVYPGMTSTTCMGSQRYWDEEGVYHCHDPNTTSQRFSCSNGHVWGKSTTYECPGCGQIGL